MKLKYKQIHTITHAIIAISLLCSLDWLITFCHQIGNTVELFLLRRQMFLDNQTFN